MKLLFVLGLIFYLIRSMESIDYINKEYFTDSSQAKWGMIGSIYCGVRTMAASVDIKDYVDSFAFLAFLLFTVCCAYQCFIYCSYKEAPQDSPARILWLEKKIKRNEWLRKQYNYFILPIEKYIRQQYKRVILPIINQIIKYLGYLLLCILAGTLLVVSISTIWFISSLSEHDLLVIIVILAICVLLRSIYK